MTVSTTTSGVTRTGDGVTLEFSFSFEARLAAEIFVSEIVGLVLVAVDPADYVVAIEPDGVGGTVTFTVAPDDGANLYIFRGTAQTQLVSVSNQTRYNPEVVEGVWDKLAFLIQELSELANRSVKTTPGGDPDTLIATLETSAATAAEDAASAAASAAAAAASAAAAALFDPGNLAGLLALTLSANKLAYPTGASTWALTDFTAAARALLDDADAAAMRTTLGLAIGTNVQAFNSKLSELAAPAYVRGDIIRRGASTLDRLDLGAARTVLGSDGTDALWQDRDTTVGLLTTTGAAIVGPWALPAGIKKFRVTARNVALSGTGNALVQLSTGASFVTTGYDSRSIRGAGNVSSSTGIIVSLGGSTNFWSGHMDFTLHDPATNLWEAALTAGPSNTSNNDPILAAGFIALAGEVDAVRVNSTAGTWATSSFNVHF